MLRYGWPNAWTRVAQSTSAFGAEPAIIGHEPSPSFDFAPDERVILDSLTDAGDDAWRADDPRSTTRYAPSGVARLSGIGAQVARFRRGDSTLVVGIYSVADDSVRGAPPILSAIIAARPNAPVSVAAESGSARAGTLQLMLPSEPLLAGIELLDTTSRTLARSRRTFAIPPGVRRISDLLIYRGSDDVPTSLEAAIARGIASDSVMRGDPIGLYWETYAEANAAAGADTAVLAMSIERIDRGMFHGLAQRFGISDPDAPIRVHWSAPPGTTRAISARAIALDSADLEGGRYRISVSVTRSGAPPLVATRELTIQSP